MGYSETMCQLCAVSLAIARYRTSNEPPEAAWDYTGENIPDDDDDLDGNCHPYSDSGCSTVLRDDTNEHLAGPGCRGGRGYSGANITLAEMKGCRDVRAIVNKSADDIGEFQSEDDDEPWERETRYFFTGTGNGSPDEGPLDNFDKIRHGVSDVLIDNVLWDDNDDDSSLPVHPACWEIFKRVSVQTFGSIDVHGFWRFRALNDYEDFFENFPRHPAVRNGYSQWWEHELGSEWLVANPVNVPGFANCVKSCHRVEGDHFDVNSNVFSTQDGELAEGNQQDDPPSLPAQHDPFAKLPAELRLMVQALLPSSSIAALRSATRSMQSIPNIVFRRLLFEDMPWLWEAREFSPTSMDWFELYKKAKFIWIEMKGVKNRARIWKEVTEICERIRVYREERKIQGITGWEDNADDRS